MTFNTGLTHHGGMIKVDQPVINRMTGITGIGGHNMHGALTPGDDVVMTALAGTNHLGMIDSAIGNRHPRRICCMTGLA